MSREPLSAPEKTQCNPGSIYNNFTCRCALTLQALPVFVRAAEKQQKYKLEVLIADSAKAAIFRLAQNGIL